ncbi:carboxypeptidase-like regulatory domain-containing protein [uncultured Croceitalea sp.]|uniref:carboxypeptidase-like regulatory domain-containing protein n=1 Tax=uncultured Croceitalea sp. TaxID=1798908 RepID=UPI0033064DD9
MKNSLLILLFTATICFAQDDVKTISGVITDGRSPIPNVAISVDGNSKTTFSDDSGKYKFEANVGDMIKYSFQGMKTVKIKVEDITRILNLEMVPDVEKLREVTVIGSNRKSQSDLAALYNQNQNIIRTAFGYINAETAAGNVRFLNEDQINPVAICILDLLRNEFSGVRVQGTCLGAFGPGAGSATQLSNLVGGNTNEPGVVGLASRLQNNNEPLTQGKVFIRGVSSLFSPRAAVFDVDGQIFKDAPIWIDVKNIKRLAILNNFATTTMYGNIGAGGVIVINTTSGTIKPKTIVDQARLRNNFVASNILDGEAVKRNWPTYLTDIHKSNSLTDAKAKYASYQKQYASLPYYALDMQKYFTEKWNDKTFVDEIVLNSSGLMERNPVLLKALAYQYQEQGDFEKANEVYKNVLKLRPDYAQSYLDLANSYRELRDTKQAAALYARYDYLVEEGYMNKDSVGFGTIMEREYNNFLLLDKNRLVRGDKADELYIAEEEFNGTRLVFEWNDSEAEFDLQFVNPGKQYAMFKHSLASNAELIFNEKEFGYNTAEYLVDNSLPGTWTVNIDYKGNKSLSPTYLKATVYYNYGTFSQRKETKVFKLTLKNVPYQLFQISVGSKLVSR